MDVKLFEELVTKHIVKKGTEMLVEHEFLGLNIRSKLKVESATKEKVWGFAQVSRQKKPVYISVGLDHVLEIESMEPERLALAYEIDLSRPPKKIDPVTGEPVRRGRKSFEYKRLQEEMKLKALEYQEPKP